MSEGIQGERLRGYSGVVNKPATAMPADTSRYGFAGQQLEDEITTLLNRANELRIRLSPVLQPTADLPGAPTILQKAERGQPESPLVESLVFHKHRIGDAVAILSDILDKLDL